MAELIAPLADVTLISGMQIVIEAVDPSTGAAITGVKVSNVLIYCDTESGTDTSSGGSAPVADEAPEFVPLPLDVLNPETVTP